MDINIIYARDSFGNVAADDGLPWFDHNSTDMAVFKNYTEYKRVIVCGYNTAITLPNKAIERMPLIVVPVKNSSDSASLIKERCMQPIDFNSIENYLDSNTIVIGGLSLINNILKKVSNSFDVKDITLNITRTTRKPDIKVFEATDIKNDGFIYEVINSFMYPTSYRELVNEDGILIEELVYTNKSSAVYKRKV